MRKKKLRTIFTLIFAFLVSMAVDDSFKKPGAIPFKWEVRPGVPKVQVQQQQKRSLDCKPSFVLKQQLQKQQKEAQKSSPNNSLPNTPKKLAPPPAGFYIQSPQVEPRTRSFLSAPRARSERYHFCNSTIARSESVISSGCFPTSPLLISIYKNDKKKIKQLKPMARPESELDCASDLETLSRWSRSSRKSLSPFRDSPLSSPFSSHRPSPRPVNDAEWAGFGLF